MQNKNQNETITFRTVIESEENILEKAIELQTKFSLDNLRNEPLEIKMSRGFLISKNTVLDLKNKIREGSTINLAICNENKIAGFVIASSGKSFVKHHSKTNTNWNEKWAPATSIQHQYSEGRFLYIDQIVVDLKFQGCGIAAKLLNTATSHLNDSDLVLAAVLREPIINSRSFSFFEKNGFEEVGELFTPQIADVKNVRSKLMLKTRVIS